MFHVFYIVKPSLRVETFPTLQTFKPFKPFCSHNAERGTQNTERYLPVDGFVYNPVLTNNEAVTKINYLQKSPNPTTRNAEHRTRNVSPNYLCILKPYFS